MKKLSNAEAALLFYKKRVIWCTSNNYYQQEGFHWYDLNILFNISKQKNRNNDRLNIMWIIKVMIEFTHFSPTYPFIPLENIANRTRGNVRLKWIYSFSLFELIFYQIIFQISFWLSGKLIDLLLDQLLDLLILLTVFLTEVY